MTNSSGPNDIPDMHLFVCTNVRDKGESCGAKGGAQLRDSLKRACKEANPFPGKKLRVNAAGCLGVCERGIAAVLYPEGQWYLDLNSNDTEKVLGSLK